MSRCLLRSYRNSLACLILAGPWSRGDRDPAPRARCGVIVYVAELRQFGLVPPSVDPLPTPFRRRAEPLLRLRPGRRGAAPDRRLGAARARRTGIGWGRSEAGVVADSTAAAGVRPDRNHRRGDLCRSGVRRTRRTASGALVTPGRRDGDVHAGPGAGRARGCDVTFWCEVAGLLATLPRRVRDRRQPLLLRAGAAATVRFGVAPPKVGAEPPKENR